MISEVEVQSDEVVDTWGDEVQRDSDGTSATATTAETSGSDTRLKPFPVRFDYRASHFDPFAIPDVHLSNRKSLPMRTN